MNENFNYTINKLRVDFEELEKRIKSIEKSVSGISTNVTSQLQASIDTINNDLIQCKVQLNNLSTDTSQFSSQILQLNQKMTQISCTIENLSQIINNLSTTEDNKIIYQNTGLNEDYVEVTTDCNTGYGNYYSQTLFLVCDVNQYIDIDFEVEYDPTSENKNSIFNYKVELLINDKIFVTGEFPLKSGCAVNKFTQRYFPEKRVNELRVHATGNIRAQINKYKIKAVGKDITLCGDVCSLSITCFDNQYFIVNKSELNNHRVYFAQLDKDELTLDISNYKSANLIKTDINEKLGVYPYYNLSTKKYVSIYNDYLAFPTLEHRYKNNNLYIFGYRSENDRLEQYMQSNIYAGDYDYLFTGQKPCYACFICTKQTGEAYLFSTKGVYNKSPILLNGEPLPSVYYKCAIVKNNNCFSTDSQNDYHGGLIWNITTQNWEYYEKEDNTYRVVIGPGKYCTAYYQLDGSINVYISRGCTVHKFVLIKDETTNQYKLSGIVSTIPKATRYDELYDGKALITLYNTYRIYTPEENI